jgi:hypothetical protein
MAVTRSAVASMSGIAAECSASVTSTSRESTQAASTACWRNAAATMRLLASSADGLDHIRRSRRHFVLPCPAADVRSSAWKSDVSCALSSSSAAPCHQRRRDAQVARQQVAR